MKLSRTEVFTQRSLYLEKLLHTGAFAHRSFYTEKSLHREAFTRRSFETQKLSHRDVFTQRRSYTQKLLHTEAFTQRSLYTEVLLHEVERWNWQQFLRKNTLRRSFREQAFPSCSKKKPQFHDFMNMIKKKHKEYISEAAGPHSIVKPTLRWHQGSSNPAESTMSVSSKIRLRRLPTSGLPHERPRAIRVLWRGAPQAADPPTPGHKKTWNLRYLKSEKSAVLTHFSDDF